MRSVFWYLVFVGLPFVGLLGILRLGEQLQPPPAVHGRYAIVFDSSGSGPCLSALVDSAERTLTVSQSGPRVEFTLGELEFTGVVAGDSLRAAAVPADAGALRASSCLTLATVHVAARLERTDTEVRLPGEFQFPGCTACAPVHFRATRLASRSGEARH